MFPTLRRITLLLAVAASAAGCNKGGEAGGADGAVTAGGGGGTPSGAGAPALEVQSFAYDVLRSADQRRLTLAAKVAVPVGWSADPNAKTAGHNMTTLLPGGGAGAKNPFALSNVTISATCHGECTAKKFPEQIQGTAKQQLKYAGSGAKILRDEQLRDGVWGFVIEADKGKDKAYTLGVTHWHAADWPYVLFCNAHLEGDEAAHWQQLYDACAAAEVTLEDPLLPAAALATEQANLARCPTATTLTYAADPAREGEPTAFGDVVSVYANTSSPGHVYVWIANFDLTTTRLSDAPLAGEQRVVKLAFEHRKEGEVLSGSYGAGYDGDVRVDPTLAIAGGTTLQWTAQSTQGTVDIIARTKDKICGRIALEGGNRGKLSGEFVADLSFGSAK